MKCPIKDCTNDVRHESPLRLEVVVDPGTFETRLYEVCDDCYIRVSKAMEPQPVSISSRREP